MYKFSILFYAVMIFTVSYTQVLLNENIHIDQFGYQPEMTKVAVLANPQVGFNSAEEYVPSSELHVVNAQTSEVVYSAAPQIWNNGQSQNQSGDEGWWFDFSQVTDEGIYFIRDNTGGQSFNFEIKENVYQEVLTAATRMFFYNRCNAEKLEQYSDEWNDETNFLNPLQDSECRYVYDAENAELEKDLSQGWFDAGDYNKYITFAESAVHNLLWAYQENPEVFTDDTNIPESGNGIPDIIDELKWELDWILKMINDDGSTHIKMGSISFAENENAPPSANTDQRYYGPTCTSASLAASGMLAHAAEVFTEFSEYSGYAEELQSTAKVCFEYAQPYINSGTLETGCDDGSILAGDADRTAGEQIESAIIAAVHLLAITGDLDYNTFILDHAYDQEPLAAPFWGPYKISLEDALLYYTQLIISDGELATAILESFELDSSNNYSGYFGFLGSDLYRAYMPDWSYHWGSNSPKAIYGVLNDLIAQYNIGGVNTESFELKAAEQLHYFHGVNPLNLVMLSNMESYGAEHYVTQIYHTWFHHDSEWDANPAPGFVTGGPNSSFSLTDISPPAGQPLQKSYLDFNNGWPDNSWEISEPAIYYQAAYIRLLANFTEVNTLPDNVSELNSHSNYFMFPNPALNEVAIKGDKNDYVTIRDLQGREVFSQNFHNQSIISIENFKRGVYLVQTSEFKGKLVLE